MNKNLSNIKLWWLFNNTKGFRNTANLIKDINFRNATYEIKREYLKRIANDMCKILEEHFNLPENSLPRPEISGNVRQGYFGEYKTEDNVIHLDFNNLTVGKLMHEFRHYIQYQFKEKSYMKGVEVPLPDPFYPFQKHEINAYNFQFLFDGINIPELIVDVRNVIDNAKDLFALGYFNKQTFDIERNYYKIYNKMCDLQKIQDKDITFKRERFKIKDYDVCVDVDKYFNLKNEQSEIDFSIIDGKCTIYAINYRLDCSLLEHFVNRNKQELSPKEQIYENVCKDAIKTISAFCQANNAKEIDINPCTPAVHKNKFKIILENIQKQYRNTEFDNFNQFYDLKADNELTESIKARMKIFDKENNEDYIDEDLILDKKGNEEHTHQLCKNIGKTEIEER